MAKVKNGSHSNHRTRLLQIIESAGLENISDYLALEFILTYIIPRKDTNPIAHKLIDKFGGLSAVLEASPYQTMQIEGMGERSAKYLAMLVPILHKYNKSKSQNVKFLKSVQDMVNYCHLLLKGKVSEEFFIIGLNSNYKILLSKYLGHGTPDRVNIEKGNFFNIIFSNKSISKVIVAHCHPDGNAMPSKQDILSTEILRNYCEIAGVEFVDHIIVGENNCYSLKNLLEYEVNYET